MNIGAQKVLKELVIGVEKVAGSTRNILRTGIFLARHLFQASQMQAKVTLKG